MAHWSEDCKPLVIETANIHQLCELEALNIDESDVPLLWLPAARTLQDRLSSKTDRTSLNTFLQRLPQEATICILTTPQDAADLLPRLENSLNFQLWIAVKIAPDDSKRLVGRLMEQHAALLVLTRYRGSLRHTKTRIQYTYCPACGKTTKDYGGKKHTYHEYGTLMADVWRDIECLPNSDIEPIIRRLSDLFGLAPYARLRVLDMRACEELQPARSRSAVQEAHLPLEWQESDLPFDSQLINADCIEALGNLPENSVDFCFADPPYNLQKKYDRWNDALESVEYFDWCDRWLSELYRVLKPGRILAVLNIPQWTVRHFQHLASLMQFQSWIAWEALGFPVRLIMPAHYTILCFSKGMPRPLPGLSAEVSSQDKAALRALAENYCLRATCIARRKRLGHSDHTDIGDLWTDIHRLKHNSRRVDHPCQLPPHLMRRLFALYTQPGEIILDCFNGSGTSTLVAQQMKRRFIGIELSTQYHQLALQRHQQLANGMDPFGKDDTVPKVKNSPVQRMHKQKYAVSKKTLQLDVKRIAQQLGRLPSRTEVAQLSDYPIEYFERYFASWGEVCAAARTTGMSELPREWQEAAVQGELFLEL